MRLAIIPIDFRPTENGAVPVDEFLYSKAMDYCHENLAEIPDFTQHQKAYVVAEMGENEEILDIHAVTCGRPAFDINMVRATGPYAKQCLALIGDRWNSYLSDRGFRGAEVLVWIDEEEKPEQQCPNREATITAFGLKPSKRMAGRVR